LEEIKKYEEEIKNIVNIQIFNSNNKKIKVWNFIKTSSWWTPLKSKFEYYENATIPWLTSWEVNQGKIYKSENFISELGLKESSAKVFPQDTVLLAMYWATAWKVWILKFESTTNQAICWFFPNDKYIPEYLYYHLKFQYEEILLKRSWVARDNLSQEKIKDFEIFLASLEKQKEIVWKIEILEEKIEKLKIENKNIPKNKKEILEKYL
jgi:type I restriction enzyme S subunit